MAALSKAAEVKNRAIQSRDYRQRVRDDHKLQMGLLGMTIPDRGEDDMGDLIVTGDIYGDEAVRMLGRNQQEPDTESAPEHEPEPASEQVTPEQSAGMSTAVKIGTAVLAATLLGPGTAGVAGLFGAFDNPTPAVHEFEDTDTIAVPEAVQIQGTDRADGVQPLYVE